MEMDKLGTLVPRVYRLNHCRTINRMWPEQRTSREATGEHLQERACGRLMSHE